MLPKPKVIVMVVSVLNSFFSHNSILRTTAKQSSRDSQKFKISSNLTESHFTRRNCRTLPLRKQGQGSSHARKSETHTQGHVHHSCNFKQDRQHSGYCRPHFPKFHLLHKSHQTQENKSNLTPNRVMSIHDYKYRVEHCKKSGRGAGYEPQQNKACPKMLRRWAPRYFER